MMSEKCIQISDAAFNTADVNRGPDVRSGNTQQSSDNVKPSIPQTGLAHSEVCNPDMVERVGLALSRAAILTRDERRQLAEIALEASHHAELVLERDAYRVAYEEDEDKIQELVRALEHIKYRLDGYADVDGCIAIADEALARIGGEA